MTEPMLIGLGGHLGSGKDVVANYYRYQFGLKVIGMSDILHEALRKINPLLGSGERYRELADRVDFSTAKEDPEVRRLLQVFGTEFGRRMIHEDLWVDLTAQRCQELLDDGHSVALTGVRYRNELAMVETLGGVTLWIDRPDTGNQSSHESERSLTEYDFQDTLINDGTIGDLENKAADFYVGLLDV